MKRITGHLTEKNGKWYGVINLKDENGKEKRIIGGNLKFMEENGVKIPTLSSKGKSLIPVFSSPLQQAPPQSCPQSARSGVRSPKIRKIFW